MPSRFIIDVISGSGTRSGASTGRGGSLIISSSVELAPIPQGGPGEKSVLYSSYIEGFDIKGKSGSGLWLSGSTPSFFGMPKPSVLVQGNLLLHGNVLNLSSSASPLSGTRGSQGETTHGMLIAANVPAAGEPKGTSEGALVIKAQPSNAPPTSMMRFFTTTSEEVVQFAVPIAGSGVGGPPELEILTDTVIEGALRVIDNVDIEGNLTVQGNVTSIDTNHLVIKDPVIYLNSGSTAIGQSAIVFASGSTRTNGSAIGMSVVDPANMMLGRRGDNSVCFLSFDAQAGNMPANGIPTGDTNRWIGIYAATGSFLQITGSIRRTAQGQDFLQGSGNTNVSYNHTNGAWTINSSGGGGGGIGTGGNVFRDHGNSGGSSPTSRPNGGTIFSHATTSGSILFNPGQQGSNRQLGDAGMLNSGIGTNVFFYVSGTMSRPPTPGALSTGLSNAVSGSALLPDLHLSGALLGVGQSFGANGIQNILQIRAGFVGITDIHGSTFRTGKDNFFFVTGSSRGAKNPSGGDPDAGNPGKGTSFAVSSVFAGDVITSGSLHLHEAPSSREFGGVELSFSTANPRTPNGAYRLFVSSSAQTLSLGIGASAQVILINGNSSMAGKVTVTGQNDQSGVNMARFIGEMMFVTQGNTGNNTFDVGTTVRIAETGGNLATGGGLMLETQMGFNADMFNVLLKNNTAGAIVLTGLKVVVEHFDA